VAIPRVAATSVAIVLAVSVLTLVGPPAGGADRRGGVDPKDCPVGALETARGTTEITFWHQLQGADEQMLEDLVAGFESSNPDIEVQLVNQVNYRDLFVKYRSGLESGELPDLGQFEDTNVQQLSDTRSTIPIAACVKADKLDLSDFYERPLAFYTIEGVLRAMPWNVSNIVTMYNRKAVAAAGLDPDALPTTFEGLRQASQQIVDRGVAPHGMALAVIPYVNEFLFAKSGIQYVNHANGRKARASNATFDTTKGRKIWKWWNDMVTSGLALNSGDQQGGIDHLLALGNGSAAITIESTGGLGRIYDVLGSGQFPNVEFGIAPLPSLTGTGGIPVGDGSLWIPKSSSSERQAAAWKLVKYLTDTEQIARLVVGSSGGFVPIRRSAAEDPAVQQLYAERPFLRVPFDQLEQGAVNTTTSGPVIGDYQGVRDAVRDSLDRMLTEGLSPKEALAQAEQESTAVIQDYNARVGGN
jgi:sn-glycerol 3-phosphate transport system substrate-binding protein